MDRRDALRWFAGMAGGIALGSTGFAADKKAEPPSASKFGFDEAKIIIEPLRGEVRLMTGPGGNIAFLPGPDGVFQIDGGVPSRGQAILAAIKEATDKPVTLLANTHWHFDHIGTNVAAGKAGAQIVAHDNVRKRLSTEQNIELFKMKFPPLANEGLPMQTFSDALTIYRNGEEIHAVRVPPAHTDGDTFFHFQKADILHAGDLYFNGFYPVIDGSSGGNLDGMVAAVETMLKAAGADTKIIPGHGPMSTKPELKAYHEMLAGARDAIKPLFDAGKTLEEVVAAKPTRGFDEKWGKGPFAPDVWVGIVYNCYKMTAKK